MGTHERMLIKVIPLMGLVTLNAPKKDFNRLHVWMAQFEFFYLVVVVEMTKITVEDSKDHDRFLTR